MKHTLRLMAISAFALLIAAPIAFAQIMPEASILPITEPTDVGGTILQPGTYTIRVVDSFANRNKVQILSQDGTKVFATVLTVPHELEPGEEVPNSTFVYFPAGEGTPRALRTWFASDPPGRHGHDIVYEEDRAKVLASQTRSRVVSYADIEMENLGAETTLSVVTPESTVETYTYTPPASTQVTETTTRTTVTTETPQTMVSNTSDVEMPATASNVPLIALFGLLALVGAIAVRMGR